MSHTCSSIARHSANGIIELFRIFWGESLSTYSIIWPSILRWKTDWFHCIWPFKRCCCSDQSDIIFQSLSVVSRMILLCSEFWMSHNLWVIKYRSIWLIWMAVWLKKLDAHSYKSFSSMNLIVRFRACFWTFLTIVIRVLGNTKSGIDLEGFS